MVTNLVDLHVDEKGNVSADYSITSNILSSKKSSYSKLKLKGTATGKIKHDFGNDSYSFELSDKSKNATISGSGPMNENDENNDIHLTIKTKTNWANCGFFYDHYACYAIFEEVEEA